MSEINPVLLDLTTIRFNNGTYQVKTKANSSTQPSSVDSNPETIVRSLVDVTKDGENLNLIDAPFSFSNGTVLLSSSVYTQDEDTVRIIDNPFFKGGPCVRLY